jgi:hypothetical protein
MTTCEYLADVRLRKKREAAHCSKIRDLLIMDKLLLSLLGVREKAHARSMRDLGIVDLSVTSSIHDITDRVQR